MFNGAMLVLQYSKPRAVIKNKCSLMVVLNLGFINNNSMVNHHVNANQALKVKKYSFLNCKCNISILVNVSKYDR